MTTTVIFSNIVGTTQVHTFAANDDALYIAEGVVAANTTGTAIGALGFDGLRVHLDGSLISEGGVSFSGLDCQLVIGERGSLSSISGSSSSVLFRFNAGGTAINYGTISAATRVAYVGDTDTHFVNHGNLNGASPAFLGLFGDSNAVFVNSGSVSASDYDDLARDIRYNNGIMIEGIGNLVTNLAGGTITAVSTEGAGVRLNGSAGGSVVRNYGEITSMQDFGVNMATVLNGQALIQVSNWGTISGGDGSYLGSVNADALTNRGLMAGDVDTGGGADNFDNRGGTVEGDVRLGGGDDTFDTRGGSVSGEIDGGAGNDLILSNTDVAEVLIGGDGTVDILDMRFGPGAIVALDGAFENAGSALGDVIGGFEYLFGSFAEADNLRGNGLGNFLFSFGGADVLDGAGGDDVLRGGTGQDTLTGGAGNDAFRFFTISEFGDVVTDFSSVGAGNNDHFQFSAAALGGGLAAGFLAANQFRTRADNAAQDADDRFIFRTTDTTLWYDADGSGAAAAILIADLQAGATVTNADILLLA